MSFRIHLLPGHCRFTTKSILQSLFTFDCQKQNTNFNFIDNSVHYAGRITIYNTYGL